MEPRVSSDVRWPREAWIPLLAGLFWLWRAPEHGLLGFLFSVLPGCLLLSSGFAMLLMPGDRRIAQFAALGGVLGVVFALPAFVVVGPAAALLLIAASLAGFVAAGVHSVRLEPKVDGVPEAVFSYRLAAEVAVDEALLGTMFLTAQLPRAGDQARIPREVAEARARFEAEGWLEKPAGYHVTPPALDAPRLAARPHAQHRLRAPELRERLRAARRASPAASAGSPASRIARRTPGCCGTRGRRDPGSSASTAIRWARR